MMNRPCVITYSCLSLSIRYYTRIDHKRVRSPNINQSHSSVHSYDSHFLNKLFFKSFLARVYPLLIAGVAMQWLGMKGFK